jgi:hypothetical protein
MKIIELLTNILVLAFVLAMLWAMVPVILRILRSQLSFAHSSVDSARIQIGYESQNISPTGSSPIRENRADHGVSDSRNRGHNLAPHWNEARKNREIAVPG